MGIMVWWLVVLIGQLLGRSALGSLGCPLIDLTLINYIRYTLLDHFSHPFLWVCFLKKVKNKKIIVLYYLKKCVVR